MTSKHSGKDTGTNPLGRIAVFWSNKYNKKCFLAYGEADTCRACLGVQQSVPSITNRKHNLEPSYSELNVELPNKCAKDLLLPLELNTHM